MVRAEAMSFSTSMERREGASIVALSGELDIATEAQAMAELARAMDGCDVLIADLRGLEFLDSSGVRVLLATDLRAREHGTRFGVVRGEGMVARLLEVTRISQRFPVVDEPDALIQSAG
jgi:anti-sigma B factor antagonist